MKVVFIIGLIIIGLLFPACANTGSQNSSQPATTTPISSPAVTKLPEPALKSDFSIEESLLNRRSIREYSDSPLTLEEVSQLLWAAQGITSDSGGRTAPSAGGLYPLEVYLIAGKVESLAPGVYRYQPEGHALMLVKGEDVREGLSNAALGQTYVRDAPVDITISAVYERTAERYGDRGVRYSQLEAGHASQNILLQATALNLGAVTIGAFEDDQVKSILNMPENESPLYIIPVGKRK